MTGKPISAHQEETKTKSSRYMPVALAVWWDRPTLYQRIERRVDQMVQDGLFEEVELLCRMGCRKEMGSMQGIGYRQVCNYRRGLATREETIRLIKRDSRRYAKRQMTWFRRNQQIIWLEGEKNMQNTAEKIILTNFAEFL